MGGIKRFCLIVFGVAGVLCLCALALPWVGPFQQQAAGLFANDTYYLIVQVLLAITLVGLLFTLLRGFLTPRKSKTVVIAKEGKDQITVTTAAISSQATHVVENQGRFIAEKVRVSAKKRGGVVVDVRVKPRRTMDVTQEGKLLHDELTSGLASICGDRVKRVNLEFVEAEEPIAAQDVRVENLEIPASVYERAMLADTEAATTEVLGSDATTSLGGSEGAEGKATDTAQDEGGVIWR